MVLTRVQILMVLAALGAMTVAAVAAERLTGMPAYLIAPAFAVPATWLLQRVKR